jgi:hypothetical protein
MQEQADQLARAVRLFKLDGAHAAPAATARPALGSY